MLCDINFVDLVLDPLVARPRSYMTTVCLETITKIRLFMSKESSKLFLYYFKRILYVNDD